MKNSFNFTKIFYTFFLVVALILIVPTVSYISTALALNPPAGNPPSGSGSLTAGPTGNIGINTPAPGTARLVITPAGQPAIDLDPSGATAGSIIGLTSGPLINDEAASKGYVDTQIALAAGPGGGGGGSLVLYYKTVSNNPAPAPTCPVNWTQTPLNTIGYGPHYLGVMAHDWVQSGIAGSGGFANGFNPPVPSGNGAVNYVLKSVAIGSDSVCSGSQTSIVPFSSIYNNSVNLNYSSMVADACFTDTSVLPNVTTCNRCIVCQK